MADVIYCGNNATLVFISGLRTETVDGDVTYDNTATGITFTAYRIGSNGAAIDGLTAVSLSYESGSNGDYSGSTSATNELTPGTDEEPVFVRGRFTGTASDGTTFERERIFEVKFPE